MSDYNGYLNLRRMYGSESKSVEGLNNTSFLYYYDSLLKIVYSIFKFTNVPREWSLPYLKERLFTDGKVVVTDTPLGVLALGCSTEGVNVYGHPTHFTIANAVIENLRGTIDKDGVLIYLGIRDNYFTNLNDLIIRYATLLAEVDGSLQTSLINSRVAHIFSANSQAQLKTMQKLYDDISKGKPAVFIRKTGMEEENTHVLFNNVKSTYIGIELLETKRTIYNEFLTSIGINNANTSKRERLNADEVNANNNELVANIYEWLTNLKECIAKVNSMFNLDIEVELNKDVVGAYNYEL